ncbi:hypothetical protein P153DRAFT_294672 [Dothidotthia symphoricarpi CBS 119687]|uniref:Zn(2)-C6 fungal-type domain-containing protein n=1 Tax=Dothidotthia symphoricarpi CBS 119687 TaxID=1392245 RepID=A0A6A6A6S0_9PLEO|nr:uncharacterized protein P153DRAFT_294672 [Dothidotthia symphoricarpi CBS 119687]KAF2127510.1 hypothetical protein P153DRAFT_294672 [Dothidotthia symphoricarpi CBS 119687]
MTEPDQRVGKRKTHTKSRRGCFQCKQRHTKCNEARPRCANCVRLDVQCTWPPIPDSYPPSPRSNPGSHISVSSPETTQHVDSFDLSIPDMRLLHHWTSKCYQSLHPDVPMKHDLWQNQMVELGFEHPFLLHGLLALSAVHKAASAPPGDRQSLLLQADSHMSRALETHRRLLEEPTVATAVPMFSLSSTLVTYNLASAQLEKPEDPIGSLHHCFMLLQGVKVVLDPQWDQIGSTTVFAEMSAMVLGDETLKSVDDRAKGYEVPEILRLNELTELLLNSEDKRACTSATSELHATALRFRHMPPQSDCYSLLLRWGWNLPERFMKLLSSHNPVACIITAYFAALLAQGYPIWWIAEWPQRILYATEQLLATTAELSRWLDWPRHMINTRSWSTTTTPLSS